MNLINKIKDYLELRIDELSNYSGCGSDREADEQYGMKWMAEEVLTYIVELEKEEYKNDLEN